MRTFRLKADATFEAQNIDDAFAKLAQHFAGLAMEPEVASASFTAVEGQAFTTGIAGELVFTTGFVEIFPT